MTNEIRSADPATGGSLELVRAMEEEVEELYADRSGSIHSVSADPAEMTPPRGDFLLVLDEGRAVGCGGLKRLDQHTCEIKRMYLLPEVRRRGLSAVLLAALEDRARELGYEQARLDTGDLQMAAKRLYEGAGYRSIPSYNDNNLATLWFEKRL